MSQTPIFSSLLCLALAMTGCGPDPGTTAARNRTELGATLQPIDPASLKAPIRAGARVYVPIYSHVYHGDGRASLNVAATLSVRNTDSQHRLILRRVAYYDTAGQLVQAYIDQPRALNPLATAEFLVPEKDRSGGSGANFLVEWTAQQPISEPLCESLMIGTVGGQGISFLSRGQTVASLVEDQPLPPSDVP